MLNEEDDDAMRRWKLMSKSMSHCDSYYVNATKFTYWSVHDGLTDTLIVNVIVFVVSLSFSSPPISHFNCPFCLHFSFRLFFPSGG